MATDKEYQALIKSLSGECERLHKTIESIRDEIDQKQYDFMNDKDYDEGIRFGLMLAYRIIDKYRKDGE